MSETFRGDRSEQDRGRDAQFRQSLSEARDELFRDVAEVTPVDTVCTVLGMLHQLVALYVDAPEGFRPDPRLVLEALNEGNSIVARACGLSGLPDNWPEIQGRANAFATGYLPEGFPTAGTIDQ